MIAYKYKAYLKSGVYYDVRQQFSGSKFGVFWAFLFPIVQLCIYATVFAVIFRIQPAGMTKLEYVLLVFSGLVPLLAFSAGTVTAISSVESNKNLLLNAVYPSELIPMRSFISAQIPSMVAFFVTVIISLLLEHLSLQGLVLGVFNWLFLVMFGIGLGWMLSLLNLVFKDVQQVVNLLLMLLMIMSPYAYTTDMVPAALNIIIYFNPLAYFVLNSQNALVYGQFDWFVVSVAMCMSIVFYVIGFNFFKRTKQVFFDYA